MSSLASTRWVSPNVASSMATNRDGERNVMRRPRSASDCAARPIARTQAVSMNSVRGQVDHDRAVVVGGHRGNDVDEKRKAGEIRVAVKCDDGRVAVDGRRDHEASGRARRVRDPRESHRQLPWSARRMRSCATRVWSNAPGPCHMLVTRGESPTRFGLTPASFQRVLACNSNIKTMFLSHWCSDRYIRFNPLWSGDPPKKARNFGSGGTAPLAQSDRCRRNFR